MSSLADLRQGSLFRLVGRLTARDPATVSVSLFTTDRTPQAALVFHTDGTVVGTWAGDPAAVQVVPMSRAVGVGDVLVHDTTGETMVVRAVWLGADGWQWSNTPTRHPAYATAGWTPAGTATLT